MNLDEKAQQAFALAHKLATEHNAGWFGIDHLVGGLLTFLPEIKLSFKLQDYYNHLVVYDAGGSHKEGNLPFTPRVKKVVAGAEKYTRRSAKAQFVTCEALLLAALDEREGSAQYILEELDFPFEEARELLRDRVAKGETSSVTQLKVETVEEPTKIPIDQVPGKTIKKIVTKNIKIGTQDYGINEAGGSVSEKKILELHFTDGTTFEYER